MTEDFLHYIWRYGLFAPLKSDVDNSAVIEVLDPGKPNTNAGPDFFNAMIKIGDTLFAGNVELHLSSADWYRHGHHLDKAYDNVILQIVLRRDKTVRRSNGEIIPTAEISFDSRLLYNYKELIGNEAWIPCQSFLKSINQSVAAHWISFLAVRRLEQKALLLGSSLQHNHNDREESFYQQLARNFGFNINGGAFEMLARSLPYRILRKHRDSLFQLEALLFGQAGMLGSDTGDEYFQGMKKEYMFLRRKYNLVPLERHLWRFLRLRPANFPTLRIAQFASLLHRKQALFSVVIETVDIRELIGFFMVSASGYWDTHFTFSKTSGKQVKRTGEFAVWSILINAVVPALFFYGRQKGLGVYNNRAVSFLKALPPEKNSITSGWKELGIKVCNAFESQALLQLKNEYCSYRRCLECDTGRRIISGR